MHVLSIDNIDSMDTEQDDLLMCLINTNYTNKVMTVFGDHTGITKV